MSNINSVDQNPAAKVPPGPSDCSSMWDDPLVFLGNAVQEYGDLVYLNDNSQPIYLLNHPDYIKHVLQDNYRNYVKMEDNLKPLVGNGIAVSEGDFWLRQRRIIQPAFHHRHLATIFPTMTDIISKFLDGWQDHTKTKKPIDVLAEMTKLTINLSTKTMFGAEINDPTILAQHIAACLEYVSNFSIDGGSSSQSTLDNLAFQKTLKTVDEIIYGIITDHHSNEYERKDLLSMLLQAKDEETGEGMTDKQLRDEVITMLLGGQSTTAIAITWLLYLLANHPDVEQQFRVELAETLGDRSPDFDDLSKLVYTRMITEETLRLYPLAWLIIRRTVAPDKIGGYDIPSNAIIYISPYLIHRHPKIWDEPERFNPERFSKKSSIQRHAFSYIPFGGGPHLCIGQNFALMAIPIIISMIAQRHHIDLINKEIVLPKPEILLLPENKILMTLQK